jgi:hypothetical protein
LIYTVSGLAHGDRAFLVSGALGTTATAQSQVGNYAYTLSTLSAGPNYVLQLAANAPTFAVKPATPTITWTRPADVVYGTVLGAAQLNATADVPGTFVYQPAAGTVLTAGPRQTLNVTFMPTDRLDYTTISKTVTIDIRTPTPVAAIHATDPCGDTAGVTGQLRNFTLSAMLPGLALTPVSVVYNICWGDGMQTITGPGAGIAVSHVFRTPGTYHVRMTATVNGKTSQPVTRTLVIALGYLGQW